MNQIDSNQTNSKPGIYLIASRRFNSVNELTGLHLILANTLTHGADYDFDLHFDGDAFEGFVGHLAGGDSIMLSEIPFEMMNASPEVHTQLHYLSKSLKKTVKLKAKALYKSIRHFEPMDIQGVIYDLYIERKPTEVKSSNQKLNPELIRQAMLDSISYGDKFDLHDAKPAIDLHYEEIAEEDNSLDAFDKLTVQLQAFQQRLENAIAHDQHSLVVIHGKGNGRLRKEVHALLKAHPMVTRFELSYNPKYDGGATEVYF